MFKAGGITGGLGGGPPKNFGLTKPATTPAIGSTSIAKTATPPATSGGTTAFKPPHTTQEITTFTPPEIEVSSKGSMRKMKINNISAHDKFKGFAYTPEELRFYDYISQNKISAPQTKAQEPLLKSMQIKEQKPQGSSSTLQLTASKTATAAQEKVIKKDHLQFTEPRPAEILTAAEFFKIKKLERKLQESSQDLVFHGKHTKDYSIYFNKKTNAFSSQNGYTSNAIKPVRFTSEMLHSITPVRLPENEFLNILNPNKIKTNPPLSQINRLQAKDLEIIREGVAEVKFQQIVDTSNFDIDSDIIMEPCFLNFYPQYTTKKQKEEKAKGMNVQATITMYGVWPAAKSSEIRKRISSTDSPEAFKFHQALMLFCHSKNSRFKSYDCLRGVFTFEVDGICDGPYDIPIGN